MESSYFVPKEKLSNLLEGAAMNSQEGIYLYGAADPSVKDLIPAPLELADPENPMFYLYIVNIREPTFAPWYMEGGIGVTVKYGEKVGVYFFNIMLSGPGALMGAFTGRESSGLPKKICDRIVVERNDKYGHCYIERKGVRLVDVELEIGKYNNPECKFEAEACMKKEGGLLVEGGGCLLHRYKFHNGEPEDMELIFYDSPTRYHKWEPASATVSLTSSVGDPYGEIKLKSVYGAAWSVCDNWVKDISVLYNYQQEETKDAMQYLFAGRFDRSLISSGHQRYE